MFLWHANWNCRWLSFFVRIITRLLFLGDLGDWLMRVASECITFRFRVVQYMRVRLVQ